MKRKRSREIAMELLFSMEISKNSYEETIECFVEDYEMDLKTIDLEYIKEVMKDCINHQGKIPGTDKIECGNYLAHDAEKAHNSLVEYYNVIKDLTTENLYY